MDLANPPSIMKDWDHTHVDRAANVSSSEPRVSQAPYPPNPDGPLRCQQCHRWTNLIAWCPWCGVANCIFNDEACINTHELTCPRRPRDPSSDSESDAPTANTTTTPVSLSPACCSCPSPVDMLGPTAHVCHDIHLKLWTSMSQVSPMELDWSHIGGSD